MTKAEKNYKRDYGHKDSEELAINFTRDGMREELDRVLEKFSQSDLTANEQEHLDERNQCRNHTLVESFMCETEPVRAAEQFRVVHDRFETGRSTTKTQHII